LTLARERPEQSIGSVRHPHPQKLVGDWCSIPLRKFCEIFKLGLLFLMGFQKPIWRGERVTSFHSIPILLSHSLNDGRSISSNSGQPEIDCGESHGCFMVSGIISRILALLNTIVG
jgi:hypothetical protein